MKKIWMIAYVLITSCSILFGQEKLEIGGAIVIKNSDDPNPVPGTIRWTGTDFQGWNGTKWVSLVSGIAYEGQVEDIDGNVYSTIKIGTQEWMTENLRTTRYRDETPIPNISDNTLWSNANYGAWSWYDNDSSYTQPFGNLYNWYAVNDGRGLCPAGWHVPSDAEWTTLSDFLDGTPVAGGPMKETGTAHWDSPNTGATNSSGFTGLPGGVRSTAGLFLSMGGNGSCWSSSEFDNSTAWYRYLVFSGDDLHRSNNDKKLGFSVRCIRD